MYVLTFLYFYLITLGPHIDIKVFKIIQVCVHISVRGGGERRGNEDKKGFIYMWKVILLFFGGTANVHLFKWAYPNEYGKWGMSPINKKDIRNP